MDQSFCPKNSIKSYPNLPPQGILKRLRKFYTRNHWIYITHFFSFLRFYVFVNKKKTVVARKVFFYRKYRYFNSLSNATHPIQIHRAVLEKLPFEKKKCKKI